MSDFSRMMGYGDDEEKMKTKDHTINWIIGCLCLIVGIVTLTFSTLLGAFLIGAAIVLFIKAMIQREVDGSKKFEN